MTLSPEGPGWAWLGGPRSTGLAGPTAQVTAGNVVSRATGLLRVLAIGGALGATFLGNVYQTANLVSNLLFELLAAGMLSSVLVPPFVALLDAGRKDEAERLAGALLGVTLAVMAAVTVAGLLARPWIMRALTVAVPDAEVRQAEIRLGSFLLVFFVPQVLLYAVGAVATAVLHSARRFAAAALAPVANNLVVIATMAACSGPSPTTAGTAAGLDLGLGPRLLLAGGTTAGVLAMTAVPLVAARRAGLRLRPRWDPRHPGPAGHRPGRAVGRGRAGRVAGAAGHHAGAGQPGGGRGGRLPDRLHHVPVPPRPAGPPGADHPLPPPGGRRGRAPVGGLLRRPRPGRPHASCSGPPWPPPCWRCWAAPPCASSASAPSTRPAPRLVADVLAAYAFGITGYAGIHLLTRASYAAGDVRTPAVVGLGVAVGGSALMVAGFAAATGDDRVVVLGLAHSVAMVVGAAVLLAAGPAAGGSSRCRWRRGRSGPSWPDARRRRWRPARRRS